LGQERARSGRSRGAIFPENAASLARVRACGLREIGRGVRMGCKNGAWRYKTHRGTTKPRGRKDEPVVFQTRQAGVDRTEPPLLDGLAIKVRIEVFSDAICPWCYIDKRRLEMARDLLGWENDVEVIWKPFQLNPGMALEGIDRQAYRSQKFGSWERSLELDARVAAVGASVGIAFAFDRIARTPNTFDAHRLIDYAQTEGK
jgi:DSBA-like thioredoxin domain